MKASRRTMARGRGGALALAPGLAMTLVVAALAVGAGCGAGAGELASPSDGAASASASAGPSALGAPGGAGGPAITLGASGLVGSVPVPAFLASEAKRVPARGAAPGPAEAGAVTLGSPAPLAAFKRLALAGDGSFAIVADYQNLARIDPVTGAAAWTKEVSDVEAIAVSPSGDAFALSAGDKVTWVRAKDGAPIRTLASAADQRAQALEVSPDGKRVAFTDYGAGRVRIVEVATGREVASLGAVHDADALRFSADGARLCATRWGVLRVWDLATRQVLLLERESELRGCSFLDASTVVTGGPAGELAVREVKLGGAVTRLTLPGEWDVFGVAVVPGTKRVAATHRGPYTSLVDLEQRREVARFEGDQDGISVSRDGSLLVAFGGWGGAAAFKLADLTPVATRAGHRGSVNAVAASEGRVVTGGEDGAVLVWDAATRAPVARLFGFVRDVTGVAIGAGGQIAFGSGSGDAYLIDPDLHTVRARYQLGEGDVSVAFSPDGDTLVAAASDSESRTGSEALLADTSTGAVRARFEQVRWSSFAFDAARKVLVAGPEPIRAVHLPTGASLRGTSTYVGESGHLTIGLVDGRYLAAVQSGERSYQWALGTEKKRFDWIGSPAAFSPDGSMFADDREALLVSDTATGAELAKLPSFPVAPTVWPDASQKHDPLFSVAFSSSGRKLVAGYGSGVTRVFTAPAKPPPSDLLFGAPKRDLVGLADLSTVDGQRIAGAAAPLVTEPERHVRVASMRKLTVSPDGENAWIHGAYDPSISVLRASDGASVREIEVGGSVTALTFSPGPTAFALLRPSYGDRGEGRVLGLTEAQDDTLPSGECRWGALAGKKEKKEIACLGYTSTLLRGGSPVGTKLPYGSSDIAAASPAGGLLAQAFESTARLIAVEPTGLRVDRKLTGLLGSPETMTFSADGKLLATASAGAVVVHDTKSGAVLLVLEGIPHVTSVAFSPDGKRLAATGDDRTARVWATDTGQLLATVRSRWDLHSGVGFAKTGRTLLTLGSHHLLFWKLP